MIKKRHFIPVIALSALMFATCIFAQDKPKADAPEFKVGDFWKLREQNVGDKKEPADYSQTVHSVEAAKVMILGQDTQRKFWWEYNPQEARYVARYSYSDKAGNNIGNKTRDTTKDTAMLVLPIEVGKKWVYKSYWENGTNKGDIETDAKVTDYEKVTTVAGAFDAYKIEYRGFWNNRTAGGSGRQSRTVWYAPELKRVVKSELKNSTNHGGEHYTEELVEFKLAP